MKDSKDYAKKVDSFFKKFAKKTTRSLPESSNKTDFIVYAGLYEFLDSKDVELYINLLKEHFVDWNDLRVSRLEEILDVLTPSKTDLAVKKKLTLQLVGALNAIFTQYDRITLEDFDGLGKKQSQQELDSIPELSNFMTNYLLLILKDSHALPINESMAQYLRDNKIVHPEADINDIRAFLTRQVSAENTAKFYLTVLEQSEINAEQKKSAPTKATKKTKKTVKKATAKKAVKKAAAKKTVKKAVAKKSVKKATPKKSAVKKAAVKKTKKAKK